MKLINSSVQETGIEEAMVMNEEGNQSVQWMELPNGCICCSVRSDLVRAVEYLVEKSENFEYVLVETDGLARPGPVAAAFWVDEELESRKHSRDLWSRLKASLTPLTRV